MILFSLDCIQMHWIGDGFTLTHITKWPGGQPKTFSVLCAGGNRWWAVPEAINDNTPPKS
jgi:hypothetical protein